MPSLVQTALKLVREDLGISGLCWGPSTIRAFEEGRANHLDLQAMCCLYDAAIGELQEP